MNTQRSEGCIESEEIDETIDPFVDVEIASDGEVGTNSNHSDTTGDDDSNSDGDGDGDGDITMGNNQIYDILLDSEVDPEDKDIVSDGEDLNRISHKGSIDDDHSDTTEDDGSHSEVDRDGDGDITMGNDQVHDFLLDPEADLEDMDVGSDRDAAGPEDGDREPAKFNHGFSRAGLGIVPPQPTRSADDGQLPPNLAGCVWVGEDWSCPYDAVFMAFWSLYKQSPTHWRNDWKQFAPEWNGPLGDNFDHLLILANTPIDARNHTEWFSRYRDRFCDQLHQ